MSTLAIIENALLNIPQGLSSSLAITFNWLVSWLVAQSTPPLSASIGPSACYFIFSAIALLGTVFISLCVPETRGKSEEEIRSIFSNDVQYVNLE